MNTVLIGNAEVSKMTRIPISTLRYMRHKGTGPKSFLLAGRVAYKLEDVEAWIETQYNADHKAG